MGQKSVAAFTEKLRFCLQASKRNKIIWLVNILSKFVRFNTTRTPQYNAYF